MDTVPTDNWLDLYLHIENDELIVGRGVVDGASNDVDRRHGWIRMVSEARRMSRRPRIIDPQALQFERFSPHSSSEYGQSILTRARLNVEMRLRKNNIALQ